MAGAWKKIEAHLSRKFKVLVLKTAVLHWIFSELKITKI